MMKFLRLLVFLFFKDPFTASHAKDLMLINLIICLMTLFILFSLLFVANFNETCSRHQCDVILCKKKSKLASLNICHVMYVLL